MLIQRSIHTACQALAEGGVIVYPTEAVFGIGCDPDNDQAVARLLHLKRRDPGKGLILIADRIERFQHILSPLSKAQRSLLDSSWPGPISWIVPDLEKRVPALVKGKHDAVALRVTAHPVASALCEAFGGAIVSTSANVSGFAPTRTLSGVRRQWGRSIDAYVAGAVGGLANPTEIRDLVTQQVIRAG